MAKFDAATAVEPMEYDFTKYAGDQAKGEIPEPTTGAVSEFFTGMRFLIRDVQGKQPDEVNLEEDMDVEEMAETLENMDDAMAEAAEFQAKSVALLAILCGGAPSAEDLGKLPIRVLRAFTKWIVREINPKEEGETVPVQARPAPQDRRPATRGSRKGKRQRTS